MTLTRKTNIFERYPWFKFNNLGLALGMTLEFHTSLEKVFELKVNKVWGLTLAFLKITGENW